MNSNEKSSSMKTMLVIAGFLSMILFALPEGASAAAVFYEMGNRAVKTGHKFPIEIYIDTEGDDINAIELTIAFPAELMEFDRHSHGKSIIRHWIEPPSKFGDNKITMSGAIPGGYKGEKGLVAKVIMKSLGEGSISLEIEDVQVLKNDGRGTKTGTTIAAPAITISDDAPLPETDPDDELMGDQNPPTVVSAQVAQHDTLFDGQWFLAFSGHDEESGISHFEIQESREEKQPEEGQWAELEKSPYLIKDQDLKSAIYIKVVDQAGNETIEVIYPQGKSGKSMLSFPYYAIIIVLAGIGILFLGRLYLKKKHDIQY